MQTTKNTSRISKIGFFSPLAGAGTDMGYGYAAVQLIQAWQRKGIPVWAFDRDAPVIFNMGQPHFYERVEGKLNIGYTPWESTKVPSSWITYMNRMDEVWTTCHENARWYEAVLDVPVRVLHHGLNRKHWPVKRRKLNGPYRFLHLGGDSPRKNAELVYEVFQDLYAGNPDVQLILKGRRFSFEPVGKNVLTHTDIVPQDVLFDLHESCHAFIYPTKGEGFGFNPFNAASSGMPTAVTHWSGPADYMEKCFPIYTNGLVPADYEPHEGYWADPSPYWVEFWMKKFVEMPEKYFDIAYRKATHNEDYWSWDNISNIAVEYMTDSLMRLGLERLLS